MTILPPSSVTTVHSLTLSRKKGIRNIPPELKQHNFSDGKSVNRQERIQKRERDKYTLNVFTGLNTAVRVEDCTNIHVIFCAVKIKMKNVYLLRHENLFFINILHNLNKQKCRLKF